MVLYVQYIFADNIILSRLAATVKFNGKTYTTTKTESIPATGHTYGNPSWTWSGTGSATAKFTCSKNSAHTKTVKATISGKVTKNPSLGASGVKTYTATVSFGGKTYTNNKTETTYLFNKSVTGLQPYGNAIYYAKSGIQDTSFTGFAKYGSDWYYVYKGKVDTSKKDVIQGTVNGTKAWWYVSGGKVQFIDSVEKNSNGWWCIQKGKVNFGFTGLAKNEYGWWYCSGGKVDFNYNGVARNEYGWWKCKGGKVDFSFTGIGTNQYGSWFCRGGKVQFDYSGTVVYLNKTYNVKRGKVFP